MNRELYPQNWDEIALKIKTEANWTCEECGRPCRRPGESMTEFLSRVGSGIARKYPISNGDRTAYQRFTLTVAHLNHKPEDCRRNNLRAWCAPCHCRYDLSQMGTKRQLKLERAGQLRLEGL